MKRKRKSKPVPKKQVKRRSSKHAPEVQSQAAMAIVLAKKYNLPISRQAIHNWIHGRNLPVDDQGKEAPCFPATDPGRYGWQNPTAAFAWYEKWIVEPLKRDGANGTSVGTEVAQKQKAAMMAKFDEQIYSASRAKALAENAERERDDKWILREVATQTATHAINDVMHFVEMEYERNAPIRRKEKLASLNGNVDAFYAWDLIEEQQRIDRIRAMCASAAKKGTK